MAIFDPSSVHAIRKTIIQTKEELFLVDAEQLKHRFHKEYPEYKKEYIELDTK